MFYIVWGIEIERIRGKKCPAVLFLICQLACFCAVHMHIQHLHQHMNVLVSTLSHVHTIVLGLTFFYVRVNKMPISATA